MKQSINFPYPVLIETLPLKHIESGEENYKFQLDINNASQKVIDVYSEYSDSISLCAEVNCSATMYRNLQEGESSSLEISIPTNLVAYKYTIDCFLLAADTLELDGFSVEKGMPIAHLGSHKIDIDKRNKGLINFVPSDEKEVSFSFKEHVIEVRIPQKQYQYLQNKTTNPLVKQVLSSQFAQIGLLEASRLLCEPKYDANLWYQELHRRWKKYAEKIGGGEHPENEDCLPFVNEILKNPSFNLVAELMKTLNSEADDE